MDRLTIRNSDGSVSQPTNTTCLKVFERLAAYEDTGLTSEEIKTLGEKLKRSAVAIIEESEHQERMLKMLELERAEAEGRLIVLPCKIGDAVYTIEVFYEGGEWKKRIRDRKFNVSDVEKMGKWIFLSREEAEAAMKGESKC